MKALLIYPSLGSANVLERYPPLSLLYATIEILKIENLEIEIIDCRVENNWEARSILPEHVLLSGKIDFCIRGFGSKPLKELTLKMKYNFSACLIEYRIFRFIKKMKIK